MRGERPPALDGLRQEKFKLNLLTDWEFYLKSARGKSQSTIPVWTKTEALSNLIFCAVLGPAGISL